MCVLRLNSACKVVCEHYLTLNELESEVINVRYKDVYEAICSQKVYYKRTDGGAEYLCLEPVKGTDIGDISTVIVRLDGGAELEGLSLTTDPYSPPPQLADEDCPF